MTRNAQPCVSVILTTYNRCERLTDIIEKVFEQSYTNIQLVICDDNSSDGTAELINGSMHDKIIYHKNECNLGYARNSLKGLELSTGEFVMFIADDDDMGDKNFIAKAVELFNKNDHVSSVFSRVAIKTPNEVIVNRYPFKEVSSTSDFLKEIVNLRFTFLDYFSLSSFIFKRGTFLSIAPFETIFAESGSVDIACIIKFLLCSSHVGFIDTVGYIWTKSTEESLSGFNKNDLTYQTIQSVSAALDIYSFFDDKLICKDICNEYLKYIFSALLSDHRQQNKQSDFARVLSQIKNDNVYIYGRGWIGLELRDVLIQKNINIISFIDDYKINFEDCISYKDFCNKNLRNSTVILTSYKYKDIYNIYKKLSKIDDLQIIDLVSE